MYTFCKWNKWYQLERNFSGEEKLTHIQIGSETGFQFGHDKTNFESRRLIEKLAIIYLST